MRQMGICQKNDGPFSSAWIILQPPVEILSELDMLANEKGYAAAVEVDPIMLHINFLRFQRTNWDDYLEHLRAILMPMVCRLRKLVNLSVNANHCIRWKQHTTLELALAVTASIQIRIFL